MGINHDILVTGDPSRQKKDEQQRLRSFADWLDRTHRHWWLPDLDVYRDYLLNERHLKPSSVAAHMASIRSRYRVMLAASDIDALIKTYGVRGNRVQASVEAIKERLGQVTSQDAGRIHVDRDLTQIYRLSTSEIDALLAWPKIITKQRLRDITATGLMLCAGLDEAELCALQIADIDLETSPEITIHVPEVPGGSERTAVAYDFILFDTPWLALYIKTLLRVMHIKDGQLLRGFFRGGNIVSPRPFTARGVQKMLKSYPVPTGYFETRTITALDLRRTLARSLYKADIDLETIQAHLGHRTSATTMEYIGPPDRHPSQAQEKANGQLLVNKLANRETQIRLGFTIN
jgi:integrase